MLLPQAFEPVTQALELGVVEVVGNTITELAQGREKDPPILSVTAASPTQNSLQVIVKRVCCMKKMLHIYQQ